MKLTPSATAVTAFLLLGFSLPAWTQKPVADCVVLLHGMGRSAFSMQSMNKHLRQAGFNTVNIDYPSTSLSIEAIAAKYLPQAITLCATVSRKIHFVTHSLGGIVVRHFLQNHRLPPGSRMVMLSPPNQGSELADRLKSKRWYRWLMGPAGQQLGTDAASVPSRLQAIPLEVGVITGRFSLEPWFSRHIPGADDGKVSVERARLEEMQDFLVVKRSHPFIMRAPEVKQQTLHFLRYGRFQHNAQ